jgi:hypothetical protein
VVDLRLGIVAVAVVLVAVLLIVAATAERPVVACVLPCPAPPPQPVVTTIEPTIASDANVPRARRHKPPQAALGALLWVAFATAAQASAHTGLVVPLL